MCVWVWFVLGVLLHLLCILFEFDLSIYPCDMKVSRHRLSHNLLFFAFYVL
jgi:hypothetical protein